MSTELRNRRAGRQDPGVRQDVTLQLERREGLFSPPALDEFGGSADLVSRDTAVTEPAG